MFFESVISSVSILKFQRMESFEMSSIFSDIFADCSFVPSLVNCSLVLSLFDELLPAITIRIIPKKIAADIIDKTTHPFFLILFQKVCPRIEKKFVNFIVL